MKKIEASSIKRILSISWYLFSVHFWSSLIILSLSLSHTLGYLEFSWSTLGECGYLVIWSNKEKEEQESIGGHSDQQLQWDLIASTDFHLCFPH